MFRYSKSLGLASVLIFMSAAFLMLSPLWTGEAGLLLVLVGIIYAAIAYLLLANRRWLAWLAFFVVLCGGIAVVGGRLDGVGFQSWSNLLLLVMQWLAAAALFAYLWQDKPKIS